MISMQILHIIWKKNFSHFGVFGMLGLIKFGDNNLFYLLTYKLASYHKMNTNIEKENLISSYMTLSMIYFNCTESIE